VEQLVFATCLIAGVVVAAAPMCAVSGAATRVPEGQLYARGGTEPFAKTGPFRLAGYPLTLHLRTGRPAVLLSTPAAQLDLELATSEPLSLVLAAPARFRVLQVLQGMHVELVQPVEDGLVVEAEPPTEFRPAAPLRAHVACASVSLDEQEPPSPPAVGRAIATLAPGVAVEVRATAAGPSEGTLTLGECDGVAVLGRRDGHVNIAWDTPGYRLEGWVAVEFLREANPECGYGSGVGLLYGKKDLPSGSDLIRCVRRVELSVRLHGKVTRVGVLNSGVDVHVLRSGGEGAVVDPGLDDALELLPGAELLLEPDPWSRCRGVH
jgi:hypothetical protein